MPEEIIPDPPEGIPPGAHPVVLKKADQVSRELGELSHKERAKVLSRYGRRDPRGVAISQFASMSMWQGPLPSPEHLERFNRVVPGSAERLIRMAEKQQDHRMALEVTVSASQLRQSSLGQYFALSISFAILGVGVYALHQGYPATAATIVTSTIVGMAYVFIRGKLREQETRDKKREAIEKSEATQAEQPKDEDAHKEQAGEQLDFGANR